MTKEMQLKIKLMSVAKQLGSSEGTRESIRVGIVEWLKWYSSSENSLNKSEESKSNV